MGAQRRTSWNDGEIKLIGSRFSDSISSPTIFRSDEVVSRPKSEELQDFRSIALGAVTYMV
jgi:hypothetical protein